MEEYSRLGRLNGHKWSGKNPIIGSANVELSKVMYPGVSYGQPRPLTVTVDGGEIKPEDVAFVPSGGLYLGSGPVSVANLQSQRDSLLQQASTMLPEQQSDPGTSARFRRLRARLAGRAPQSLSPEEKDEILPADQNFMLDQLDLIQGLAHVIVAYRIRRLEAIDRGTPDIDANGQPLGPPPWDVVNEALRSGGFAYELMVPSKGSLLDPYELSFQDRRTHNEVKPADFSSGEKVILQLITWLYAAPKSISFPRLLILDEPDAHLHPSMTTQFLTVISNVLVDKYGIRVIMTTHSPSTVALAPVGSVFRMERGATEVTEVTDRDAIIAELTSGLLTVSKTSRFCFVEDEDDVEFYNSVRDILSEAGPSRDVGGIPATPSIAFLAASVGKGATKVSGGYANVQKWVDKLDRPPLDRTFCGLIDRDLSNVATQRVLVIGRYSIENYILDPLNIFGLLVSVGAAPSVPGVVISPGDEHLLRDLGSPSLQKLVTAITEQMELCHGAHLKDRSKIERQFTRGQVIEYPGWVENCCGHDLLPLAQACFGGHQLINRVRLSQTMRRVRMIPTELRDVIAELQTH